jgi:hypothetical protein
MYHRVENQAAIEDGVDNALAFWATKSARELAPLTYMLLLERCEGAGGHYDATGLEMMPLGRGGIGGGIVGMDELRAFPVTLAEVAPVQHCPFSMNHTFHEGG